MTKRTLLISSLLISSVTMAVANAAGNFNLNLYQTTTVNGTAFKPGDAKLELKDTTAILKQGKVTAEAPVKVEANPSKFEYTSVVYREGADHKIKEIRLAGTTKRIVFE